MSKKKKFVLIQFFLFPYHMLFRDNFKKKYDFYFIDRFGVHDDKYDKFVNVYVSSFFEKIKYLIGFIHAMFWYFKNRKNIKTVVLVADPNWFLYPFLLMSKGIKKIFFPYEITTFRKQSRSSYSKLDLILEKKFYEKSDKILHKGLQNELELLPYKVNKPHRVFREYLTEYRPIKKVKTISSVKGGVHIVHIGGIIEKSKSYWEDVYENIDNITKNKVHYYIYSKVTPEFASRLKKVDKDNKYFHFMGALPYDKLMKEIGKYDYGSVLHVFDKFNIGENYYLWNTFGNRMYDFVKAGLPIVVPKPAKSMAEFVDKENIGITTGYHDLYEKLSKGKKKRPIFEKNMDKVLRRINPKKLIDFIEK